LDGARFFYRLLLLARRAAQSEGLVHQTEQVIFYD
jgi:hypothetical protein